MCQRRPHSRDSSQFFNCNYSTFRENSFAVKTAKSKYQPANCFENCYSAQSNFPINDSIRILSNFSLPTLSLKNSSTAAATPQCVIYIISFRQNSSRGDKAKRKEAAIVVEYDEFFRTDRLFRTDGTLNTRGELVGR